MTEVQETQTTLRDQISAAVEQHETPAETPVSDRPRDESGRFTAAQKQEQAKIEQAKAQQAPVGEVVQQAAEVPAQVQQTPTGKARPTSWKKDYEEHWGKLDPTLQDYLIQRESEFANGVSTYKKELDHAKPFVEAMQPFLPLLQQHNIQPSQWISNLGNAHRMLAMGSPEEKQRIFAQLANDYGVQLGALTGQQADPQFSMMAQELSQLKNQLHGFLSAQEQQSMASVQSEISKFAESHPHFEALRESMSALLQSGMANDLQSAYDKAIRLNDELWQQTQEEARQAKLAEEAKRQQEVVAQAKAKAVSPRSGTPTAAASSGNGKKGLRGMLEEQVNNHFSVARV